MRHGSTLGRTAATLACVLLVSACVGQTGVTGTPSPSGAPAPPSATAAPATASSAPTAAPTTARPTGTAPTAGPTSCQTVRGGDQNASRKLDALRVAHQPGSDRVVFDFGPGALPPYQIEPASSFMGPAGQPIPVQGNVHLRVRFPQAGGMPSFAQGPQDVKPGLPLVQEVRVVEDFEGVLVFGIGLARLECPRVSELSSPARLVLDFPTPP